MIKSTKEKEDCSNGSQSQLVSGSRSEAYDPEAGLDQPNFKHLIGEGDMLCLLLICST